MIVLLVGFVMMSFQADQISTDHEVVVEKSRLEWKATKVGGGHEGIVQIKSGAFHAEGTAITSGSFVVDMPTIKVTDTESSKLERHLRSEDFFNVTKYPEAKLTITASEPIDAEHQKLTGEIFIVGKSQPITLTATLLGQTDNFVAYKTTFKIDRTKFGIDYRSSLGDAFIMDDFEITAKITAQKK